MEGLGDHVPMGCDIMYANFMCDRVQICIGRDCLSYLDSPSSPAASIIDGFFLVNSATSTKGAGFVTYDRKDFYLNTPMAHYEYIHIHRHHIPTMI